MTDQRIEEHHTRQLLQAAGMAPEVAARVVDDLRTVWRNVEVRPRDASPMIDWWKGVVFRG